MIPRVALTSGEPAGIGPELCLALARDELPCELVCLADRALLSERATRLNLAVTLHSYVHRAGALATAQPAGSLTVEHWPLGCPSVPGRPDTANVPYVLALLERAIEGALSGEFDAIVTAPVHKGVINDAGVRFSGHTEYFAEATGTPLPVMLLVGAGLRVALATTHLPLAKVSAAIRPDRLESLLAIMDHDLRVRFGIRRPRILVLGLNPHAGESGHLGREEIEVIAPALERLRKQGLRLEGPVPADTAFLPRRLAGIDAVLAMFHDQGLPVLKHASFGHAVNVTLGLPIIRTSVDHGTAFDIAGKGVADPGSLVEAIRLAARLASGASASRKSERRPSGSSPTTARPTTTTTSSRPSKRASRWWAPR
jgi:4-hydroxythreonine-4-phosphate dehydrogenase